MSEATLLLWTNGCDWVVASNEADAVTVYEAFTGEKAADYGHDWREDTRESITIKDDDGTAETHSAAKWAAKSGRGYLWCTEE